MSDTIWIDEDGDAVLVTKHLLLIVGWRTLIVTIRLRESEHGFILRRGRFCWRGAE